MAKTHILISNDDGIDAFGLKVLVETIREMPDCRVSVVAPESQQSATSRCMTLNRPLRVKQCGPDRWTVSGTPTDTIMVALGKILRDDLPDYVLSGINHGPNLGEDVHYSGTVAAAMEGCVQGVPGAAISLADWHPSDFGAAAAFVRRMLPELLAHPLPAGSLWNVNVPNGPESSLKGVQLTRQGSRKYYDVVNEMTDPRGRPIVWIGGKGPVWDDRADSDFAAVRDGYASMTPLKVDLTDHESWRNRGGNERRALPGSPVFAGAGDRFVLHHEGGEGLTIEGPTRGGSGGETLRRPSPADGQGR
ncbi:MAG TPA: 5'/3'-nucleotidase SurE [Candidatus Krumholzibacteria bacterium]|nr:5'/3'-nucleotidase SurE [Candidatus Krumholzibacteria bacterium]HPD71540.1 5'/3'-nucleotidase SurE [Candidatus Krumholzibacteria bacterium]HRY41527.1 5'/3'-nucleotidase SurE [Candidatus Krumholzibacteria bacterium]